MLTPVDTTATHYVMSRLMYLHILLKNFHHVVCGLDEDVWYSVAIWDVSSLLQCFNSTSGHILHIGPLRSQTLR